MPHKTFNYDAIAEIDSGRVRDLMQHAMDRCMRDCRAEPGNTTLRKVTLTLSFRPETSDAGRFMGAKVAFDVGDTAPKKKTGEYYLADAGAELQYDPDEQQELPL